MEFGSFVSLINNTIHQNLILNNPGGGTSEIISVNKNAIRYKRGNSIIAIKIKAIYDTYNNFKGSKCSTNDLKDFNSDIFGTNGHPCNCTFFFLVMKETQLCTDILGNGKRNSPFYIEIINDLGRKNVI